MVPRRSLVISRPRSRLGSRQLSRELLQFLKVLVLVSRPDVKVLVLSSSSLLQWGLDEKIAKASLQL